MMKIEDMEAAGKVEDEEDIDHHIQNSESTSTYINFHLSDNEEDNTSYANEPKVKQSRILSKQKQDNIAITTTENKIKLNESKHVSKNNHVKIIFQTKKMNYRDITWTQIIRQKVCRYKIYLLIRMKDILKY